MQIVPRSFTFEAAGRLNVLATPVRISQAFDPRLGGTAPLQKEFAAIWDTGATNSVITQKVVDACGLSPVGMVRVHTGNGETDQETYLVYIQLPNGVGPTSLRVTKANCALAGADVLIGMDIIGAGDFAVTNFNGKTKFTFRFPSCEHIDFVTAVKPAHSTLKPGRNDPCPCGSGKKFKKCHGP